MAAWFTVKSFISGHTPWLNASISLDSKSLEGLNLGNGRKVLRATLDNDGPGVAVIKSVTYTVVDTSGRRSQFKHHEPVLKKIESLGLQRRDNCHLGFFVPGTTLGPNASKNIWEMVDEKPSELAQLDIEFRFAGQAGEQYSKTVFVIPRLEEARYQTQTAP